jgi:Spy/CpxP family protein refolding chaperone
MTRAGKTAALMLVLTFSVGALAGMAVEEAFGIDWFEFLDEDSDDPGSSVQLMAGIQLSREQRAKVHDIVERQEDELEDYWEGRIPEIQGILTKSYAEIRSLLTPEQQSVFDRRVGELAGRVPQEFRD